MPLVYRYTKRKGKDESFIPAHFQHYAKKDYLKKYPFLTQIKVFALKITQPLIVTKIFRQNYHILSPLISPTTALSLICHIIQFKIMLLYIHTLVMMKQIPLLIIFFSIRISIQICQFFQ